MTMTSRERFCRLYDFQPVDRPTRWEVVAFWPETVDEWIAEGGLPAGTDAMAHYGMEPRPTIGAGLGLTWMHLSGDPINTWTVEDDGHTRIRENDLGQIWRERLDGQSMPQWLRFPVECRADWERKIKPRLDPAAHDYGDLHQYAAESRTSDDPWGLALLGLYAFWRNFWGEEQLAYAFYDEPETLHAMAEHWLLMHAACLPRAFAEGRFDYVLFHEDMAFKNGPLISPAMFSEFMAPHYRQLFAVLRAQGQHRFLLDSDGNNGQVLEHFIDLGMNGLYPFEVAAGYDVVAFRREHPDFFIWGGIDKRVLLGSRDDIAREVLEKAPALWETGGFIPSIDHSVPPCPQANFEYFMELARGVFAS